MLTAIVIGFGTTALLLALAYRSWLLTADDEVEDDIEDRLVGGYTDLELADELLLVDEAEQSDDIPRRAPAAGHRDATEPAR